MKKNKYTFSLMLGIVYIILLVTILVFKAGDFKDEYWISIAFMTIALIVTLFILCSSKGNINNYFFNLPLYSVAVTYLVVEFITGLVFITLSITVSIYIFWAQFLIFAIFLIYVLRAIMAVDNIKEVEQNVEDRNTFIHNATVEIENAKLYTNDYELKKKLDSLAEEMKYSAPKCSYRLNDVQTEICNQIATLKQVLSDDNNESSQKTIMYIHNLITERNNLCKNIK